MTTNFENSDEDYGQQLLKKAKAAFNSTERRQAETIWREIAEFIIPSQNAKWFGSSATETKRNERIFDITGPTAARDLASAMQSTITNPASKWTKIRFRESKLNNIDEAMQWSQIAENEIHYAHSESNYDSQMGSMYQSLVSFATAALLHEEVEVNGLYAGMNFVSLHLSEIAYDVNQFGQVDCLYRKFELTNRQALEKFGSIISELNERADYAPNEKLEFYQCIHPRSADEMKLGPTGQATAKNRPFASVYIMSKGSKVVKEDGYYEFPVYVPRWLMLPGEIYGYGPGHIARPDVLTLNTIKRQLLKGLAKAVDPVIFVEENNIITGDMRPGRFATVRNVNGMKEAVTQSRFDIGFMIAEQLQNAIRSAFYIDKLMLPPRTETGEMTAYEIQQRLEQMQVILGPPLTRLNKDVLQPNVMRSLNILMRAGRIPPIPDAVIQASESPEINGTKELELDVAFVNPLARSQQLSELRNISSWVQEVGAMAQIKPEALDRINGDAIAEEMARIRDIPEHLIVSDNDVEQIRTARQEQTDAANQLQGGEMASNIVKNIKGSEGGRVT